MSTSLVSTTRPKRFFYAINVNMNLSFDSLAEMAKKMLGAELEVGDILICDNSAGDKRKVLQMTKNGFIIYYARMNDDFAFEQLQEKNGQLKRLQGAVI